MITPVVMPQMGLEVTEGVVAAIHVGPGDRVSEGDALVELETDKALTDVSAPRDGVVRSLEVAVGDTVGIGATLVVLAAGAGEAAGDQNPVPAAAGDGAAAAEPQAAADEPEAAAAREPEAAGADEPEAAAAREPEAAGADEPEAAAAREPEATPAAAPSRREAGGRSSAAGRTADGRLRAAPVARRAARAFGLDLEQVDGTGPRGRITLRDVERAAGAGGPNGRRDRATPVAPDGAGAQAPREAATPAPPAAATPTPPAPTTRDDGDVEPMSPMRRAIARRMTLSQQIPQFTLTREVDASWLLDQKDALGRRHAGVGVNDLLLQVMAEVALRHPAVAAAYTETADGVPALLHRDGVDLGLAVATPRGLVVPVVRGAHARRLPEIAAERARLVGDARSGRPRQEDMGGATMTLSNLSSFGVDHFTAMLNPGETAILAVGRVADRLVPRGRGIAVVPVLTFSMTIDHRVADGATGAAALVELAELVEGAMTWRA